MSKTTDALAILGSARARNVEKMMTLAVATCMRQAGLTEVTLDAASVQETAERFTIEMHALPEGGYSFRIEEKVNA